ncbi:MAG: YbgC/FadM family acyl-CoA thioesterase [Burkholderiaceae bacterium]|nr:MAG: YbgC/FadM family acyl-CoA thioesterase [Burkholderiaceae bacterium]
MAQKESLPQRGDYRLGEWLQVRWSEVDVQQIVFNAHYLTYFDTAMAGYWRALALPYADAMAQLQGDVFLRKTAVDFHASARMEDWLEVCLRCARVGTSSIVFSGAIFCERRLLVQGELVYVFADPKTQTSRPVPPALRAVFERFEAGQAMTELRVGDWSALGEAATRVRRSVFVEEQGIAAEDELDQADASAVHTVVFNHLAQPVATARLLPGKDGTAHIGRMAVLRPLRRTGLGEQALAALERAAHDRGDNEIRLSAQRHASGFYQRLGYSEVGAPYEEVGIPHVEMSKALEFPPD